MSILGDSDYTPSLGRPASGVVPTYETEIVVGLLLISIFAFSYWFITANKAEQVKQFILNKIEGRDRRRIIISASMTVILLAAVLPLWPYEFYMLVRVVVFATAAFVTWTLWQEDKQAHAVTFGIVAMVFNPFIPAHLTREIWTVLNLAAAGLFIWSATSL